VKVDNIFVTDSTLLETPDHWISDDVVSLEIKVGFVRNLQKCDSVFMKKSRLAVTFTQS